MKRILTTDPDGNAFEGSAQGGLYFLIVGVLCFGMAAFLLYGAFFASMNEEPARDLLRPLLAIFGIASLVGSYYLIVPSRIYCSWNKKFLCFRSPLKKCDIEWDQVIRFEISSERTLRMWLVQDKKPIKIPTMCLRQSQSLIEFTSNRLGHLWDGLIPELKEGETFQLPVKHAGIRLATITLGHDSISHKFWTGKFSSIKFADVQAIYRNVVYDSGTKFETIVLNDGDTDRVPIGPHCQYYDPLVRYLRTRLSHARWVDPEMTGSESSVEIQLRLRQRQLRRTDEWLKAWPYVFGLVVVYIVSFPAYVFYRRWPNVDGFVEKLIQGAPQMLLLLALAALPYFLARSNRRRIVREITTLLESIEKKQ